MYWRILVNLLTSKVVISLIEFLPREAPLEDDPEL